VQICFGFLSHSFEGISLQTGTSVHISFSTVSCRSTKTTWHCGWDLVVGITSTLGVVVVTWGLFQTWGGRPWGTTALVGKPHWLVHPLKQQRPLLGQSTSNSPGDQQVDCSADEHPSLRKTTGQDDPWMVAGNATSANARTASFIFWCLL